MKKVPSSAPAMMAISDQTRLPPPTTEKVPTASVAICALLMNHNGPWLQTSPCRSLSGT
jgi:hypothetical protein